MKYLVNNNLTVRDIAGETFIMLIWRNLAGEKPFEEIVRAVEQEFDVSSGTAEEDVFQFLQQLERSGLLTITEP